MILPRASNLLPVRDPVNSIPALKLPEDLLPSITHLQRFPEANGNIFNINNLTVGSKPQHYQQVSDTYTGFQSVGIPLLSTILIQSRPIVESIKESNSKIIPGFVDIPINMYNSNDLTVISSPNNSSQANNDAQTLRVINSVPSMKNLPQFIYQKDPKTGVLTRYLAIEKDTSYDTDQDFGISQEWLLFQRQGDQIDRLSEWISDPVIADAEAQNESGFTLLNRGRVWYRPPKSQAPIPRSGYYNEYKKYLEYSRTQIEEQAY